MEKQRAIQSGCRDDRPRSSVYWVIHPSGQSRATVPPPQNRPSASPWSRKTTPTVCGRHPLRERRGQSQRFLRGNGTATPGVLRGIAIPLSRLKEGVLRGREIESLPPKRVFWYLFCTSRKGTRRRPNPAGGRTPPEAEPRRRPNPAGGQPRRRPTPPEANPAGGRTPPEAEPRRRPTPAGGQPLALRATPEEGGL